MNIDPIAIGPTDFITLFDQRPLPGITLPGLTAPYFSSYIIPSPVVGRADLQYPNGPFVNLRELPIQQQATAPTGVTVEGLSGSLGYHAGPFIETLTSPGAGQFQVNYTNGTVNFNAADAGTTVLITYKGLGSEIRAEHINNIIYFLKSIFPIVTGGFQNTVINTSQETTLVSSLTIANAGLQWFNSDDKQFKGWNGNTGDSGQAGLVILG